MLTRCGTAADSPGSKSLSLISPRSSERVRASGSAAARTPSTPPARTSGTGSQDRSSRSWRAFLVVAHGAARHHRVGRQHGTRRQHRIGADARTVADQRTELVAPGALQRSADAHPDFAVGALVAEVAHDAAGLQVDIAAEDRIADEV